MYALFRSCQWRNEFRSHVDNSFPNCQQVCEVAGIFKGLSQGGIREQFSKNLRASLFNEDLSNEPNFGRIHLAGQWTVHLVMFYWANQEVKKI